MVKNNKRLKAPRARTIKNRAKMLKADWIKNDITHVLIKIVSPLGRVGYHFSHLATIRYTTVLHKIRKPRTILLHWNFKIKDLIILFEITLYKLIWIVRAFWLVYKCVFIPRYEAWKWREQCGLTVSELWEFTVRASHITFLFVNNENNNFIKEIINHYWTRLSKISWFVSGEQINYLPKLKIINLRDNDQVSFFSVFKFICRSRGGPCASEKERKLQSNDKTWLHVVRASIACWKPW